MLVRRPGRGRRAPEGTRPLAGLLAAMAVASAIASGGLLLPRAARGQPAEYLPVRSPFNEEVRVLAARGELDSLGLYTRPYARIDIARSLLRAKRLHPGVERTISYQRLERELARELTDLGDPPSHPETGPLVDVGPKTERFRVQSELHFLADDANDPSNPELEVRDETFAGARMGLQLWPAFAAFEDIGLTKIRTARAFIDPLINHTDVEISVPRADLTARVGPITTAAGYDMFRWGPGRTGTLLLSDASGPMGFFSLQGSFAGRVTATAVSGVISSADGFYLAAHRLEFAVSRHLTVGLAEAARYQGNGIDPLYAIGIIPYTLIERTNVRDASNDSLRALERSNVMASTDVEWRISPNVTIYGELLIDDLATEDKTMPSRVAYQAGFRSDRPVGSHVMHLLGEYSRVPQYTYSVYYGQSFIHHGDPIGYSGGADMENLWLELSYDLSTAWQARWTGDFTNRGEGGLGIAWDPSLGGVSNAGLSGVVEQDRTTWVDGRWLPRDDVDVDLGVGYQRVENFQHVDGRTETAWLVRAAAELRY
jgi:hypothetical protein